MNRPRAVALLAQTADAVTLAGCALLYTSIAGELNPMVRWMWGVGGIYLILLWKVGLSAVLIEASERVGVGRFATAWFVAIGCVGAVGNAWALLAALLYR